MKRLLVTMAALIVTLATSYGQGEVFFANRVPLTYDNKVVFQGTTTGVPGPDFKAQLYLVDAGGARTTAIGTPTVFRTGNAAGYITGATIAIPGIPEGQSARLQMVVFNGASFETSSQVGTSVIGTFTLGGSLSTPPNTQFGGPAEFISVVPEPSTIALGVLGAAALLFRRRK